MYKISWDIKIDGKHLQLLDSVEIRSDIENLMDTATIKLPSMVLNRYVSDIGSIQRGQTVEISLGYDGNLSTEFTGYVSEVTKDDGLVIECSDDIYLFNSTQLADKVFTSPKLADILKYVISACAPSLTLNCQYDFSYDKFTISTATGLDVLRLIQDECHAMIFIKDGQLNVTSPYVQTGQAGTAKYNLSKNVQSEGYSLKYKDKTDRKLKVTAKGKGKDGKEIKVEVGEGGGDTMTLDYKGISTEAMLTKIATEAYDLKSYTGYEGTFQGWLLPVCKIGYRVELTNELEPERNGAYFCKSVTTSVSGSGGVRKIELGKKLS